MSNQLFTTAIPAVGIALILLYISLCIHETGHLLIRLRYTLKPNNRKFILFDAIGTFLIPLISVFSLTIPAGYTRCDNEDHLHKFKSSANILLSGILFNLAFFIFTIIVLKVLIKMNIFAHNDILTNYIKDLLFYFAAIQLSLIFINLIPIPPLDMGQLLMRLLKIRGEIFGIFGGFILLLSMYFGILQYFFSKMYFYTFKIVNIDNMYIYTLLLILFSFCIYHFFKTGRIRIQVKKLEKILESGKKFDSYLNNYLHEIQITKESNHTFKKNIINDKPHFKKNINFNNEKDHIDSILALINKISNKSTLNNNEIQLYINLKTFTYNENKLCPEEKFSLKNSHCIECSQFKVCVSREFRKVDLRNPKTIEKVIIK